YQAKLERKQAFLFRTVDIAMELAVLVATVSRADKLRKSGDQSAVVLADVHARNARRLVEQRFHELWANDDDARTALGRAVLAGEHLGLEDAGIVAPAVAPAAEAVAAK
ncbi:MAG: acyl-CoA dehydrogenase, partial [Deltaproteobacteria bacterium]|nr:acyl-CoA dehydrogenase [Deltaproteobacteria bacterium]